MAIVNRGFGARRRQDDTGRVPPGQHLVDDFPVLSAGPTQHTATADWTFSIDGQVEHARQWSWEELMELPQQDVVVDIHCVTSWTKLGTRWRGVSVDDLLEAVAPVGDYAVAFCDGGYTTNLPVEDLVDGKAWIVHAYDGEPLEPEHGGPVRLLVPHLYLWKSAKWVRGLRIADEDEPGFWEVRGYHLYGDPWREQRYWGD
jgi:DMSO/TMAO reductase YedYZ molybdopterin-dependent catalytic subunit